MNRLILLTICIFALSNASSDIGKIKTDFIFLNDTESFLRENPNVELIPLEKKVLVNEENLVSLQYTFGERKPGDRYEGGASNSWTYEKPTDVQIGIKYSEIYGVRVTYLVIDVQQSTSLGRAYIYQGGIGQRLIAVAVEADSTTYFKYNAKLYGLD